MPITETKAKVGRSHVYTMFSRIMMGLTSGRRLANLKRLW